MQSSSITRVFVIAFVAIFLAAAGSGYASEEQGLTVEKLQSWLNDYGKAWESKKADKAVKLFSADATYQESPYDAPFVGKQAIHDYWSNVTKDQKNIEFTSEVLSVSGNTGIAHWHAEFTQPSSGSKVTLDGIFVLQFAADGLCHELKEWWHFKAEEPKGETSD